MLDRRRRGPLSRSGTPPLLRRARVSRPTRPAARRRRLSQSVVWRAARPDRVVRSSSREGPNRTLWQPADPTVEDARDDGLRPRAGRSTAGCNSPSRGPKTTPGRPPDEGRSKPHPGSVDGAGRKPPNVPPVTLDDHLRGPAPAARQAPPSDLRRRVPELALEGSGRPPRRPLRGSRRPSRPTRDHPARRGGMTPAKPLDGSPMGPLGDLSQDVSNELRQHPPRRPQRTASAPRPPPVARTSEPARRTTQRAPPPPSTDV